MRGLAFVGALLLAFQLVPLAPAEDTPLVAPLDFQLYGWGPAVHGLQGVPVGEPQAFVVIMHGYGHKSASHATHLQRLAENGTLAIAMDFRGEGFALSAGAIDTSDAIDQVLAIHPVADDKPRVLYSVSMGTAATARLLALRPTFFDAWVDNEGLAMLAETHTEASLLAPANDFAAQAVADIEAECHGAPSLATADCYRASSAALVVAELGISFPGGAVLTHGLNDGLVPYNQGREMAAVLRAGGTATDFYTVATCPEGSEGTTITGHATSGQGFGVCGHGTESEDEDTLTSLSFSLLDRVLAGSLEPANRELVVDGTLGTLP